MNSIISNYLQEFETEYCGQMSLFFLACSNKGMSPIQIILDLKQKNNSVDISIKMITKNLDSLSLYFMYT